MNVAYANEYLRETTDEKLGNRGVGDELRAQIEGDVYKRQVKKSRHKKEEPRFCDSSYL